MESLLFALKSTLDTWLNSSYTAWTIEIVLAVLCGLGLFFLFLPYHQNNPSFPHPRKRGNSRKHQMDLRGRSRSRKRSRALKICRDCLEELEGIHNLVLLLQSHVGSLPDKSSFHQLSWQDPPGVGQEAAPAGAHQPSMEPLEKAVSAISPAPLTQDPVPLASTLSAEPQDRSILEEIPFGTVAKSSPPGNSFLASTISAMAKLSLFTSYFISFLSCWWDTTKTLFFPTSSQSKSWKEDLSPHPTKAPSWGRNIDKHVEIGSPSFINPDVQNLLEILITKRVEQKICKEGKKDRSFSEQMSPNYHLNTSGNMWKSLGTEQDITTPQSFWNVKDKPEQLPEPQQLLHPESLRDHIEQKYSQLFWGLPSLHSESLVAATLVPGSSSQSQAPFVLFNGISNVFPVSIQPEIPLSLSQNPLLPCAGAQPQPFTQTLPMYQPPPMVQIQGQPYLPSPLLFRPAYSSPQVSTCGLYCLPFQNNPLYFIPTETQSLEYPLLQKQLKTEMPLPSVNKRIQEVSSQLIPNCPQDTGEPQAQRLVPGPHGDLIKSDLQKQDLQKKPIEDQLKGRRLRSIHLSLQLSSSQCQFLVTYQAQGKQGSWQLSAFRGKRSQDTQKTRSKCPRRSHRRSQMKFQLETDFSEGLRPCLRGISKDPSRSSFTKKFLQTNSEKESERSLLRPSKSDSRNYLISGPGKKHLEKVLKAHLDKKLRQIDQGFIPVTVRRSWLAATHASPKTHLHKEIRTLASLKHCKPCINVSHELSFLSPSIQQMLEAHIIRLRVRHRWDMSKQGSEPVNLKPSETQPSPLPTSTFSLSAIWQPGPQPKTNISKFLGKPQPHQEKQRITKASVPSLGSPLPAPTPARWDIQRALGKTSPSDSRGPSEAPLTGQKGRPPCQMPASNLKGRTRQSGTVLRARKSSLNPSLKKEENWGWLSKYPCHNALILDMGLKSQSSRSKQKAKEDPAWEVFLGPTVPVNSQTSSVMDLRRSDDPVTKKTLPPSTNSVGQYSNEPCFKTQVASKFEFGSNLESENQLQDHATGDLLQKSHTDVLLQDYTTGMLLQDFATNLLLQDPHTDVLLAANILASHRSSSQMEYASGDTPASQVPYSLKGSAQSTQEQQKFQKPKDSFKSQKEMLAPTEEWRDFQSFQPGEHEEMRSIQREQKHGKPKVRDPCKGQFASAEGEICEKLKPEEDRETISQGKMFAPTERRDFKRPQQEEDEDMKSKREMLAIIDEWRKARRLQSREKQKPKVRDPCKGPYASIQEEGICENLELEEDEDINSQIEMCPPAGEWWSFNKPLPRRHQETESQSKIFTSTEACRAFKSFQPGEPEEMKSQRERLTPTEEGKTIRRLQPGEREKAERSQKPRKLKVRGSCEGTFFSLDEGEICENLEPEENEDMNSQTEMCPPAEEWRGFKKPPPKGHEDTKSRSEMLTSPEGGRAFKRPLRRQYEETNSQKKMLAPAEEWKAFKRPPREDHEKTKIQSKMLTSPEELRSVRKLQAEQDMGSSQRQQKQQEPRKPKVRDPCKGPFASVDEGEICEKLESEEDEEMNSQSSMCPPAGEWRGFKKPPPKGHEETKSRSGMLTSPEDCRAFKRPQPRKSEEAKSQREITPAEEWKSVRRLQPGEHENTSYQRQQKPRKTNVRDPCKGPFASVDEEEVCERPKPEEDEEMHSQSRMLAPADGRKCNWRPKMAKYEERTSGLRASHTSVMSQSPQARETESLGSKYLHFSPEKEQLLPENYLKERMRHFLQCLSSNKKDKQIEETFQKGRPASAAAQCQEQIKEKFIVDGKTIDPEVIGTAVGQVLVEKLRLQQGNHASEVNHHREPLQALVGGHSHHHRALSSSEQRKMLNSAHSQQDNPKDHRHLSKSRHTRDRCDRQAIPPREPESSVRSLQHGKGSKGLRGPAPLPNMLASKMCLL